MGVMVPVITPVRADIEVMAQPLSLLSGRIHSTFRSVVNIAPRSGDLWCIGARDVVPGPRTVIVDRAELASLRLRAGDAVVPNGTTIRIGSVALACLAFADPWTPDPIVGSPLPWRITAAQSAVAMVGTLGSSRWARITHGRIRAALGDIAATIGHRDFSRITAIVASIVGLGVGLTPAGDDVLSGLAYGTAALDGSHAAIPRAIAKVAVTGATHAISLTALHEACRGRAHQSLIDLLRALCGVGNACTSYRAVSSLVAIGHTSGTYQAIGLLTAARLYDETRDDVYSEDGAGGRT